MRVLIFFDDEGYMVIFIRGDVDIIEELIFKRFILFVGVYFSDGWLVWRR